MKRIANRRKRPSCPVLWLILTLAVMTGMASIAGAAPPSTTLDVEAGFGGQFRPGRWSPVFITVKSDGPRQAIVQLRVASASASVMEIEQSIGMSKEPQTYILYAPMGIANDPVRVTLIDPDTGKIIARKPENDNQGMNPTFGGASQQIGFVAITSGRSPIMQGYRRQESRGDTLVVHQPAARLPIASVGYDAADMVVLNDPDWSRLNVDQQRVLVDWVRAGGTLLIWPGVESMPADSLLTPLLPCKVGELATANIPAAKLEALTLPKRFAALSVRRLTPVEGARTVPVLDGVGQMVVGPVGLGQIAVLPLDASTLQFDDYAHFKHFWDQLIEDLYGKPDEAHANAQFDYDIDTPATVALERIGDIPNTGAFGFSYIAILIGAMMLIVGPVDYLVLKKLGRQPWTWATTLGWIGVVTIGALYAGNLLRSGDLHFRSLRLVDQADGQLVSENEVALVYAPRSATYTIEGEDSAWWQPVPSGDRYNDSGFSLPLQTHQTYRGNTPEPVWIDIWNWRFLQSQKSVEGPAMIKATLKQGYNGMIIADITNRSDRVLKNLQVRMGDRGALVTPEIKAGETVHATFVPSDARFNVDNEPFRQNEGIHANFDPSGKHSITYDNLFRLNPVAQPAIARAKGRGAAILYATIVDPAADIRMTGQAVEQHNAMLRAVIEFTP